MNLLMQACGITAPLRLDVQQPGASHTQRMAFDLPFVLIGRDPRSDLYCPHREVSRRHAYLQVIKGHVFCVDLGSRIGTYIDDHCQRRGWVEPGQTIRVGPYHFRVLTTDGGRGPAGSDEHREAPPQPVDPDSGIDAPPRTIPMPPPLVLELSHRSIRPSVCRIRGELALIGSSADCKVRLIDPSVSNHHASLLRTEHGTFVIDLLGHGGVRVNGANVRYARIYEGDELAIGHSLIRIRGENARDAEHEPRALAVPRERSASARALAPSNWGRADGRPPVVVPAPPALWKSKPGEPAQAWSITTDLDHLSGPADNVAQVLPSELSPELVQPFMAQMVDHFGQLQRNMLEQFQSSLFMMFQMFADLRQDQAKMVREELDQIRALGEELERLRAETVADRNAQARLASNAEPAPAPRPEPAPASNNFQPVEPRTTRPEPARKPLSPAYDTDNANEGTAAATVPAADQDVHLWLNQRIASIQEEQQTRWQRIISMMPGIQTKPSI